MIERHVLLLLVCSLQCKYLFLLPLGGDEHVQGGVLLYALCPGCIRLAHVPDEEAWLWAVPPRQLLPVSTQTRTHTFISIWFLCLWSLFSADQISHASQLPSGNPPRQYHSSWIHSLTQAVLNLSHPHTQISCTGMLIISLLSVLLLLLFCSVLFICSLLNDLTRSVIFLPSCTSLSGSRLSQSVTVEEDNCCGCNVLAIRRHFLDRDLKQVHIVYTSCHDAVSNSPS